MTNKELIDHCNSFWGKRGRRCEDCPYSHTYCDAFLKAHHHETPFMCDTLHDGKYYTDEEIEYEN